MESPTGEGRGLVPCTIRVLFQPKGDCVEYRRLGGSGVKVSELSLGSWLTYGGSVAEQQATDCIHKAYELGINFFDTDNVYVRGSAEEIVGNALKRFERDSYFLATKV